MVRFRVGDRVLVHSILKPEFSGQIGSIVGVVYSSTSDQRLDLYLVEFATRERKQYWKTELQATADEDQAEIA